MDHLSKEGRSRNMSAIRSQNTKPELDLRRRLRDAGLTGYRLHRRELPGRPDAAFLRWKVAIFVDGVFWHGHPDHWDPHTASSEYWRDKITRNMERDAVATTALEEAGWIVIRIWDKELRGDPDAALARVVQALAEAGHPVALAL